MRKLTRALSFILALALAVSLLGVTAFADDGGEAAEDVRTIRLDFNVINNETDREVVDTFTMNVEVPESAIVLSGIAEMIRGEVLLDAISLDGYEIVDPLINRSYGITTEDDEYILEMYFYGVDDGAAFGDDTAIYVIPAEKTIISGLQLISDPYEFDDGNEDATIEGTPESDFEGDGYCWNADEKILTLSGAVIAGIPQESKYLGTFGFFSLIVPDGTTIELAEGTTSTIYNGIYCPGDLTITGSGTLNVPMRDDKEYNGYRYNGFYSGIRCDGNVAITGTNYSGERIVSSQKNIYIVNSNVNLTCHGDFEFYSDPLCAIKGSIDIKDSKVVVEGNNTDEYFNIRFCAISADGGSLNLNGLSSTNIGEVVETGWGYNYITKIDPSIPATIGYGEDTAACEETAEPDATEIFREKVSLLLIGFFG